MKTLVLRLWYPLSLLMVLAFLVVFSWLYKLYTLWKERQKERNRLPDWNLF